MFPTVFVDKFMKIASKLFLYVVEIFPDTTTVASPILGGGWRTPLDPTIYKIKKNLEVRAVHGHFLMKPSLAPST
jgi:hypothetical protein